MTEPLPRRTGLLWVHRLFTAAFIVSLLGAIVAGVLTGVRYVKERFLTEDKSSIVEPVLGSSLPRLAGALVVVAIVSAGILWILDGLVDD